MGEGGLEAAPASDSHFQRLEAGADQGREVLVVDLIFIHLQQFIFEIDGVAVHPQGAGLAVFHQARGRERIFGTAALHRSLEAVGKILGDIHPLVTRGFYIGDVGCQCLLAENAGIQGSLRNAHVEAGLDSLDHAND